MKFTILGGMNNINSNEALTTSLTASYGKHPSQVVERASYFNREGEVKANVLDAQGHCKGCWLYEKKGEIAEHVSDLLEEMHREPLGSKWSFEVCLNGCWKEDLNRNEYEKGRNNRRYHKLHPEAKYRKSKVTMLGVQKLGGGKELILVNLVDTKSTVVYKPHLHELVEG